MGLGGRLDATNCIPSPVVCGISSLGFDHMELLGNTLQVRLACQLGAGAKLVDLGFRRTYPPAGFVTSMFDAGRGLMHFTAWYLLRLLAKQHYGAKERWQTAGNCH